MPISLICPSCNSKLKAPDKAAGRTLECPKCKTRVRVRPTNLSAEEIADAIILSGSPPPLADSDTMPLPRRTSLPKPAAKFRWKFEAIMILLLVTIFGSTVLFIFVMNESNTRQDDQPANTTAPPLPVHVPVQPSPPAERQARDDAWREGEAERLRLEAERRKAEQDRLAKEAERARRERQAVLKDGTNDFKRIVEYPERYEFGLFYFNGLFGSPFGNMHRDKKTNCYTVAFTCQRKYIAPSRFGLTENDINFVVPDDMGEKLLALRDAEYFARIYCRIRYGDPDNRTYPIAVIYRVEFYSDATCKGKPEIVVE